MVHKTNSFFHKTKQIVHKTKQNKRPILDVMKDLQMEHKTQLLDGVAGQKF